MKEILYIPTGEIVKMLTGEKDANNEYEAITAGTYISSGKFKSEFDRYEFYDQNKEPYDLFIAFLTGEIKEDGELIFGDHVYNRLKVDEDHQNKLTRVEFEIIESQP